MSAPFPWQSLRLLYVPWASILAANDLGASEALLQKIYDAEKDTTVGIHEFGAHSGKEEVPQGAITVGTWTKHLGDEM